MRCQVQCGNDKQRSYPSSDAPGGGGGAGVLSHRARDSCIFSLRRRPRERDSFRKANVSRGHANAAGGSPSAAARRPYGKGKVSGVNRANTRRDPTGVAKQTQTQALFAGHV